MNLAIENPGRPAPGALSRKDFQSRNEVRWCPGCGDYAVLAQFQKMLAAIGARKEEHVIVSGIGCSSRFPYYVGCYGLHGIHGRAPAIATGVKLANPKLTVWVVTGDGDGLSIGAGHLLHALRRNVDIKILLFNNRIYGLTKGQFSPTSPAGLRTRSSPDGNPDTPVNPIAFALTAGASFVARTVDIDSKGLQASLVAAFRHRGSAFIEILQNCPVFLDGAFDAVNDRANRLILAHGAPMSFADKVVVRGGNGRMQVRSASQCEGLVHDEADADTARELANLGVRREEPVPLGIVYRLEREIYAPSRPGRTPAGPSLESVQARLGS